MKKAIGILGVIVFTVAMFFNTNTISGSNSDTSLVSLMTLNSANAESCQEEPRGCPIWIPHYVFEASGPRLFSCETGGTYYCEEL